VEDIVCDRDHNDIDKTSYWSATLSDGRTVYDDRRKGAQSAWIRLRNYLREHKEIKIQELFLTFGKRHVNISKTHPNDFDGFACSNRVEALIGVGQKMSRGIGIAKGPQIHLFWLNQDGVQSEETLEYQPDDPRVILDV
jgi:hypothetical protein